ncbi:MAG: sigma factor [Chitinophagaceae bacterium]
MQERFNQIVDHLFRHESGKMIAVLSKLLGLQHLQTAQDITQDTLLQALHTWSYKGVPDNPTAWLYRVAKNKAVDHLRREKTFRGVLSQHAYLQQSQNMLHPTVHLFFEEGEIEERQRSLHRICTYQVMPLISYRPVQ